MKVSKKFILFLFCVCICISAVFIIDAYAKYITSATGNANIPIARWNIKVNNQSIKTNPNISSSIVPTFPGNDHIASNIIAPTAEGYFDLVFDFTGADVSFSYNIDISPSQNSSVSDLVVTGYSIDNGNTIASDGNITDNIYYSSNISNRIIRVYIIWDDSSTASMNNLQDTQAVISSNSALLDVNINFTQITD